MAFCIFGRPDSTDPIRSRLDKGPGRGVQDPAKAICGADATGPLRSARLHHRRSALFH